MSEYFIKHIQKQNYPVHPTSIKFWTQFRNCVYKALKKREWKEWEDGDWDLAWVEKETVLGIFDKGHLTPNQRVNHFRNHYELTRKDNMIKNLKRHRKALEKEGKSEEAASYDFFPTTYNLPGEYTIFCDEFKKNTTSNAIWIMKPIGKCQGRGIFLFKKLSQIADWSESQAESYIVQRYINNPLLIGGKKFDLRIYCLVTSYAPLVAYLYRDGFARFTHHRYNNTDISNSYVHLTNVAIQKHSENYDKKIGGKWDLRTLKLYLISKYGQEKVAECFMNIQILIIKTLQSVQKVIWNDRHCFELYGFDILIDANLKPWVLEVNGSPSMTANTKHDNDLKCGLLDDTFTIVDMERVMTGQEEQIGGFDLICKGNPILNETSLNPSMLGCFNNRSQQLEKLSKIIATKLEQAQQQGKEEPNADARKSNAKEVMHAIPPSSTPDINALNVRKAKSTTMVKTQKNLFNIKQNLKPYTKQDRDNNESRENSVSPHHHSRLQKGRTVELPPLSSNLGAPLNSTSVSTVSTAKQADVSQRTVNNNTTNTQIANNINSMLNSAVSTNYSQINTGNSELQKGNQQKVPHPPNLTGSMSTETIKGQYNTVQNTESNTGGNSSFIQLYEVFGTQQSPQKYNSTGERPTSVEKRLGKGVIITTQPGKDSSPVVNVRRIIKERSEADSRLKDT